MKLLTRTEIDCCRRIGRDEVNNRSCIALAELDALCDAAAAAIELRDALHDIAHGRLSNPAHYEGMAARALRDFT